MTPVREERLLAHGSRWFRASCAVGALAVLWALLDPGDRSEVLGVGFLLTVATQVCIMVMAAGNARVARSRAHSKLWWAAAFLSSTSVVGYGGAGVGSLLGLHTSLSLPSASIAFQAIGQLALIVMLLRYPLSIEAQRARTAVWLDIATIMTAIGAFIWRFSVSPHFASHVSPAGIVAVLVPPLALFIMCFALVKTYFAHLTALSRRAGWACLLGLGLSGITEAVSPAVTDLRVEHWVFALRALAVVALCYGAWSELHSLAAAEWEEAHRSRHRRPFSVVPYIAVVSMFGLLIAEVRTGSGSAIWSVIVAMVLSTAFVIARQVMAFVDNAALLQRLDSNLLELQATYERERAAQAERDAMEVQLRHAQKLESVGQLAAGIAHEINTPIQFIADNVRFLSDALAAYASAVAASGTPVDGADELEFFAAEVPTAVEQTLDGVERVTRLVKAVQDFGRPNDVHPGPMDVRAAIVDTVAVAGRSLSDVADVDLDLDEVPLVLCAASEINQSLLHVITNAAQAIAASATFGEGRRGRVRISLHQDQGEVVIGITDDGGGIPAAIRDRVFDPFFTTKPVGQGTGQGLNIVYGVVERHGGSITFDTEEGVGTTFWIRLPLPLDAPSEAVASG